jgi:hypothetical protein
MIGSSIFDNVADAGNGGGIAVLNGGDLTVSNTTVASNVASFQSVDWPGGWGGGLYVDKSSQASLVHASVRRVSRSSWRYSSLHWRRFSP